jgi:DNA-binding MarR family transcriptional regulator
MIEIINEARSSVLIPIDDLIHLREAGIPNAEMAERELLLERIESLKARPIEEWPAILITRTSIGYIVIDGYHRIAAALALGRKKILAEIRPFPNLNEMVEEAWRANRDHGQPLSAESRSAYAWWLHVTYPQMEQIEIAKRARISQPTVSKVIKRHEEKMQAHQARHLVLSLEDLEDLQKTALRRKCKRVIDAAWSFYNDLRDLPDEEQQEVLDTSLLEADRAMLVALLEVLRKLSG